MENILNKLTAENIKISSRMYELGIEIDESVRNETDIYFSVPKCFNDISGDEIRDGKISYYEANT